MIWDILIASIEHRHDQLGTLLDVLEPQIVPGVNVIVYRDNLETHIGPKRQRLLEASRALYVSFIDDDDTVAPDFVERVMTALTERPDYVGFEQLYTVDGVPQRRVFHSLRYGADWHHQQDVDALYRGITHFNPIRRALALCARFDTVTSGPGEDQTWAIDLTDQGIVRSEVYIDEPIHHHHESTTAGFSARRTPLTGHPPLDRRPFVQYLEMPETPPPPVVSSRLQARRTVAA